LPLSGRFGLCPLDGGSLRPIHFKPTCDKEARLLAQSPKFEAGQVLLPLHAIRLGLYVSELMVFPNGAHDDQVDSTSQAFDGLSRKIMATRVLTRPNPSRQPQRPGTRLSTRQVRERRGELTVYDHVGYCNRRSDLAILRRKQV